MATAKLFLTRGWKVVGTFNDNPIPLDNHLLITVQLDLSTTESIRAAVEGIKASVSSVDVLINNAAVVDGDHDDRVLLARIRRAFEVNLFGLIDFTESILPLLRAGSHIINLDSNYGSFSCPIDNELEVGYRLSKAALNMYSRILAFRLRDRGIIVSSLDPGWCNTDMGWAVASETGKPFREPEDAANEIVQLVTTVKESGHFWRFGNVRDW